MRITVNDKQMILPDGCNVKTLCEIINIKDSDGAAIAVGMDILTPADYLTRQLREGDKVTVIRATCGG